MGMTYTDEEGNSQIPIMGCYGIGVGRLAASVMEAKHDEYGPIWPITIAPWQVHLCCMRPDKDDCKEAADKLYSELMAAGIEVIYDDRKTSAGAMFADADLLGVPVRVTVGPKNLANGELELSTRDKAVKKLIPVDNAFNEVKALVDELFAQINARVRERI